MVCSIGVGLICFATFEAVLNVFARHIWPDYAAAFPSRSYTASMLWVRLVAGAAGTFCAGLTASLLAQTYKAALWFGAVMLVSSIIWHIGIWAEYPVWYHLAWFASLLPMAAWGGRFNSRQTRQR
jgi:hypothetical protein